MTENIQLQIIYVFDGEEIQTKVNDFMKGKNILATQIVKGNVWIWYKTAPDNGYDGFRITECKTD